MVHFALTDDGEFEVDGWGEETTELIMTRAYPVLDEARMESSIKSDEERAEIIRNAVAKERERVVEKRAKKPKTLVGQNIKVMADVPTKKIDRMVDQQGEETLRNFKGKAGRTSVAFRSQRDLKKLCGWVRTLRTEFWSSFGAVKRVGSGGSASQAQPKQRFRFACSTCPPSLQAGVASSIPAMSTNSFPLFNLCGYSFCFLL
jgi:hypothetical protein